jgi:seryl-tRNA synthetase
MDISLIDQEYQKLQDESNNLAQKIQAFANKLQQAKESGSSDAKEWILDFKEIALAIQAEQNQMFSLLLSIHGNATDIQNPNLENSQKPAKKGLFSNLLGSGIGQAMEMGLGFGLGDDLINSIF